MFGRSKSKVAGTAPANEAGSQSPAQTQITVIAEPITRAANGKAPTAADAAPNTPPGQAASRRAIAARNSAAFAQIVTLLMRSPHHKSYPIAALEWLVIPPLLAGQFSIARSKTAENALPFPVAVALWAKVSPEVDKRLSDNLDKPMQLLPKEWCSGDTVWLEAIGSPGVLPQFLEQLCETRLKGHEVKMRSRDAAGRVTIKHLRKAQQ